MIRVAIVEDDPVWLALMTDYLSREQDMKVVATADSKDSAMSLAEGPVIVDVVLMDINLSGNLCDGIVAALHFFEKSSAKVIMLTVYNEKQLVTNAITAGACNYIQKDNYREIPSAIRLAHQGSNPLESMLEDYRMLRELDIVKDLSPSEREILSLAKDGLTRVQMEETLHKSENTIKTQVKSIISKMQVKSLKEAVSRLRFRGIH